MLYKKSPCWMFVTWFFPDFAGFIDFTNKAKFHECGFRKLFLLLLILPCVIGTNAQKTEDIPTPVSINAITGLQYDLVRFKVKPGAKIKITLNNVSDMSHNLLIVKPGTRLKVINAALQLAEKGPQMDYIPKVSDVLWSVPLISPGQVKPVTFTAPSKPGVYPYVCTFPGHGFVM